MRMIEFLGLLLRAALMVVAVAAVTFPCRNAFPAEFKAGDITVDRPWARATPGGAKVAAGYLIIKNNSDTADRLLSVSADIAGKIEIHQMSMTDGVMKMRQVTDGVQVPAHGSVALEPNAYHLMLLGLEKPLQEGETFAGTLNFEKAGAVNVTFEVKGLGAAAPHE